MVYCVPPIYYRIASLVYSKTLSLDKEFRNLKLSAFALQKLIKDFSFETVIDVGSGAGDHAKILHKYKKKVTALDFGSSIYAKRKGSNYSGIDYIKADFLTYNPNYLYDCLWASHILEHQMNPGIFIKKCMQIVKENGIIAITIPPTEDYVLGGHLINWNAGYLIYNLVINGLDCSDCSILRYGSNVSVIVRNIHHSYSTKDLTFDHGDITKMLNYFPKCIKKEQFYGGITRWNW